MVQNMNSLLNSGNNSLTFAITALLMIILVVGFYLYRKKIARKRY